MATSPKFSVRSLLILAWPVILARSSQAVIGFCDALMSAPLGEEALSAVTTGALNTFALVLFPIGLVFIVQSFSAQYKGKGDMSAARRYGWYGLILTAITAVLAAVAVPFVRPTLAALGFAPGLADGMGDYLGIRLFAVGAIVGVEALGNWYAGLGNTRIHMNAGLLMMGINVPLNWLLIEGNLGAPALGVAGAAFASAIASWLAFVLLYVMFRTGYGEPIPEQRSRLSVAEFWRTIRFGAPNGLNWFLELAAFTIFINFIVADLGVAVLAAMMVVFNVNSVSFMPAFGIASGGAILAGQAIGRDQRDEVPGIVRGTATVAAVWQGCIGMIYLLAPGLVMSAFAPPGQGGATFLEVGAVMLAISAAWQLFDSVAMAYSETLRAAGDTTWCLYARLVIVWLVFTPAAVITVRVLDWGYIAAMVCMVVYLGLVAVAMLWRFRSGAWRAIDLTGDDAMSTHSG